MTRHHPVAAIVLCAALLLTSLGHAQTPPASTTATPQTQEPSPSGVWYEIFVRSFYDTDGDGIGDLNGVTAKLDYLKSLGVDGLWLMPINPSPSYHGYDVTDYEGINQQYGSMADFQRLLGEAHKRHIKVIIDLVINHTSSQHPWFLAANDPHDPHRDWYSWAGKDTALQAPGAAGTPAWHRAPGTSGAYLGVFSAGMPDLDYDTPAVRQEMIEVGQYWLAKGVDGFRLDAARHIYDDFKSQDGDPAVLKKNLAWWSDFRHGLDAVRPGAYVVGEVTLNTSEQLAPYFAPLSAAFDFPLATQLILSARQERGGALAALLTRTGQAYRKVSGTSGVDATFLSNHDQDRVMSQLGGNAQHMRTAAAMLLTLPGHPFVYYGEELGMRGRKPDENLREPMRWQRDPRGAGETRWKAFSAGDSAEVTVEAEQGQADALLGYYTLLIGWRRQLSALRDGALHMQPLANPHAVAWELQDAHSHVLVVHNLSGQPLAIAIGSQALRRFTRVTLKSAEGIAIDHGKLQLPPYSVAVLD